MRHALFAALACSCLILLAGCPPRPHRALNQNHLVGNWIHTNPVTNQFWTMTFTDTGLLHMQKNGNQKICGYVVEGDGLVRIAGSGENYRATFFVRDGDLTLNFEDGLSFTFRKR